MGKRAAHCIQQMTILQVIAGAGMRVVADCIWDAGPCFAFIFSFVAIGAITVNLLFIDSWDALLGEEADSFFLTFVVWSEPVAAIMLIVVMQATFVLTTSGENWEEMGEPVIAQVRPYYCVDSFSVYSLPGL